MASEGQFYFADLMLLRRTSQWQQHALGESLGCVVYSKKEGVEVMEYQSEGRKEVGMNE